MQQFFWLLNQLLQADAGARSRRLSLQTYRVVPFSPAAGLLAWVEDTVPLADYLIGPGKRSGAHARYRAPGGYSFEQVREWFRGMGSCVCGRGVLSG